MTAIDSYLRDNSKNAASRLRRDLLATPSGRLAIVTCMDCRLDPAAIFGLEVGEAHVIRNAGGVVTDDVIRSLTISQNLLGTREIMVILHTDCGMLNHGDDEMKDVIEAKTGSRPAVDLRAFSDLDDEVRRSISRITASPFLVDKSAARGFVYEVETGRLREIE